MPFTTNDLAMKMAAAIQCGVCEKPAEKRLVYFMQENRTYRFVAECHGDTESCELDVAGLLAAGGRCVKAEAFKPKAEAGKTRGGGRYA